MPKILCECGEVVPLHEIPCQYQWNLISDEEFERFHGMVDASEIYSAMRIVIKCPRCSRLWVYWDGFDKMPDEYVLVPPSNTGESQPESTIEAQE